MRVRISIRGRVRPSVRPSVPCYFRTTKNVISCVPMMTKFNMDQEKVKDNSKMPSKLKLIDSKYENEINNNATMNDDEKSRSLFVNDYRFFSVPG